MSNTKTGRNVTVGEAVAKDLGDLIARAEDALESASTGCNVSSEDYQHVTASVTELIMAAEDMRTALSENRGELRDALRLSKELERLIVSMDQETLRENAPEE